MSLLLLLAGLLLPTTGLVYVKTRHVGCGAGLLRDWL